MSEKEPIFVVPFWKAVTTADQQLRLNQNQMAKVSKNFKKDLYHVPIKFYSIPGIGFNIYAERGKKKIEITDYENW